MFRVNMIWRFSNLLPNISNKYLEISGNAPDVVISSEDPLHIKSFQQQHDDHLIEIFEKTDLSQGKHFVVLHPYACHTPYDDNCLADISPVWAPSS